MICLTAAERDPQQLARRLARCEPHALHEVRLDLLEHIDEQVLALLAAPRRLATCRSACEGGGFRGSEHERCALLRKVLEQQPTYLDLEASTAPEIRRELEQRLGATQLIYSWHGYAGAPPPPRASELAAYAQAALLKVAWQVEDAAELAPLYALQHELGRPVLSIGMGPAGLLSRALYRRFGSPWTYVAADENAPTAAGQLTLAQAHAWRIEAPQPLAPLGLVGGPVVLASPGPRVYNALFARRDLDFIYLPVLSTRPAELLPLLEQLGFTGCSVTMPAKRTTAELLGAAALEPLAARVGAVNTLVRGEGGWRGLNTDISALVTLLTPYRGRAALVLGAGGAAAAAIAALRELDAQVTVTARDDRRAALLAARLQCEAVAWSARGRVPFAVLVNATPCGSDGLGDPMPEEISWPGRALVDAVIAPAPTPLVRRARAGGAEVIDGVTWWREQGAAQLGAFLGPGSWRAALMEVWDEC